MRNKLTKLAGLAALAFGFAAHAANPPGLNWFRQDIGVPATLTAQTNATFTTQPIEIHANQPSVGIQVVAQGAGNSTANFILTVMKSQNGRDFTILGLVTNVLANSTKVAPISVINASNLIGVKQLLITGVTNEAAIGVTNFSLSVGYWY